MFDLLDVVVLNQNLPDHALSRGQVGTIVECLASNVYEVDFSDNGGQTYAMLPLHASQLMQLDTFHSQISSKSMSNIHQYGQGDNIAGDKVMGDKINTQINNQQDLAQAAQDIKTLFDQLSTDYNPNTPTGQMMVGAKAIETVEQNPTLKKRVVAALKGAGEEALEQAIQHPVAKIFVEGAKGLIAPGSD